MTGISDGFYAEDRGIHQEQDDKRANENVHVRLMALEFMRQDGLTQFEATIAAREAYANGARFKP